MNEIRAIETFYKGKKFRSRLEARWAIFLDEIEARWTYEEDGLVVNGEPYLPDFQVYMPRHIKPFYLEIKPNTYEPPDKFPSVYLAGKVSPTNEWRGEASVTLRSERLGVDDIDNDPWNAWVRNARVVTMAGAMFNLVGPFPSACDHGCGHRPESRHMAETCSFEESSSIIGACRGAIEEADIICAHIDTPDAYGTLVELGMAVQLAGRGKPHISLTIAQSLCDSLARWQSSGHVDDEEPSHDLWFVETLINRRWNGSTKRVANTQEAREFHAAFINKMHPAKVRREVRLAAGLALAGNRAAVAYGDPWEVAENGSAHCFEVDLPHICTVHKAAAEHARAYRFDRR